MYLGLPENKLRDYINFLISDEVYYFDAQALNSLCPIFPRISRFWTLTHIGEVRKIQLRDTEFFFSESKILPFCKEGGVWVIHNPDQSEAVMTDPDVLERNITRDHAEL